MRKKLQNLERLSQKMEARFGEGDDLVIAFKQELVAMQKEISKEISTKNFGRRKADQTNTLSPTSLPT